MQDEVEKQMPVMEMDDAHTGAAVEASIQFLNDPATRPMTYGECAVGLTFNPSNNVEVDKAKRGFAALIDQMNVLKSTTESQEGKRMAAVAITQAQTAQMWAVKAITCTWK